MFTSGSHHAPAAALPLSQQPRTICELRGYCGPFRNEEYFAAFGDGSCRGMGTCIHCAQAVKVADELEKWEASLWRREFGWQEAVSHTTPPPDHLRPDRSPVVERRER